MNYCKLIGTGSFVPDFVLDNAMLENMVETSDEWIVKRTGIRQRHISKGRKTWEMGFEAAKAALEDAGLAPDQIDLIIVTTCTPDTFSPIMATRIQYALGAPQAAAIDVNTCCTGFINATDIADSYIRCGKAETVLVVSAETLSRIVDYENRNTCILFGDAAAAVVYQKTEQENIGILSTFIAADGSGADYLYVQALPTEDDPLYGDRTVDPKARFLNMQGAPVVRFTATAVPKAIDTALHRAGLSAEQIDWVVPHQANLRILQVIAHRYNLPAEKIYVNLDRYGNTSSASIPLCLDEMRKTGRWKPGQTIVAAGFGGGMTYGAAVIRI